MCGIIYRMTWLSTSILNILLTINSLVGNLGWTIIIFTVIFRGILLAFTWRSLKSMSKMRQVNSELQAIRKKYKDDPQAANLAQLELYKRYNINPMSGCLPQILQIFMLIVFYQALRQLLGHEGVANTSFFWLDLTQPDAWHIIPILAAATQLFLSVMTLPGGETRDIVPNDSRKKSIQKLNEEEEDMAQMAATMQKQMLFMMPFMTGMIAWSLPSGLGLYWIVSTIFSIVQQVFLSGWGGITLYFKRFISIFQRKET